MAMTERKSTESPSAEVLRLLYQTMNDGVVAFDQEGKIVFCNPAMAMLVGAACEELVGKTATEAWGGERIELPDETSSTGGQFLLRRRDGTHRIVMARSFYLRTAPPLQIAIYRDVTRYRTVEHILRSLLSTSLRPGREVFLQQLVAELVRVLRVRYALIGTLDPDDRNLLHVHACWVATGPGIPFACRLEGGPCERLEPDRICYFKRGAWELFPNEPFLREHRIESFLGAPLVDSEGKVMGVIAAMDVRPLEELYDSKTIISLFATHAALALAQFEAARELQETQERYAALVDQAREGFYLRELAPARILFVNDTLAKMFGYRREEMLVLHPLEAVAPEVRERVGRIVSKMVASRRPHLLRFLALRKDGQRFVAELLPSFVTFRGRACLQATVRDVTERLRAEQERRLLARLAQKLSGDDTIERIAKTVEEVTQELFAWDAYFFVVRRPGEDRRKVIEYVDTIDGVRQVFPGTIDAADSASGPMRRALGGEPVLIDVAEQGPDPTLRPFGDVEHRSQSLLYVPIRTPTSVIGVISIQSYRAKRYGAEDLNLLQRVATTVAPALQRARAEYLVRDSEERYRRLVELAPVAIFVLQSGRIRYANPAAVRLLGASQEDDLIDVEFLNFVEDNVRPSVGQRLELVAQHHTPTPPVEYGIVRMDGKRVIVESREIPTTFREAEAIQIVLQDVTERKEHLRRIQQSEQQLKLLFEQTPLAVIRWGADFRVEEWNPAAERIFGYTRTEALGRHALDLIVPDTARQHVVAVWNALIENKGGYRSTNTNVTKDGRLILCEWYNAPLVQPDGRVVGVASLVQDVTERERVQEALRESEERYSLVIRGTNDGIWDWNLRTGVVYYSPRWKEILGVDPDEELSSPNEWFQRIHPDDRALVKEAISRHLEGPDDHFEMEFRMTRADGALLWVQCRGVVVRDADGVALRIAGSLSDVSARKKAEQQMLYDALHDALTGLPNRHLITEHIDHALAIARRDIRYSFATLLLDLDRFKLINDSFGHRVGDELLRAVAQVLRRALRPGDLAARISGDEFLVLFDDVVDAEQALGLSKTILRIFDSPFRLASGDVYLTASGGLVVFDGSYATAEEILRDADTAMFRAKSLGKNRIEVFAPEMRLKAQSRLQLETDLRRALDQRQVEVLYQPIVQLPTGAVWGFEAILRWRHPQRGLLLPLEFLAVAEETGIIVALGDYVLRRASEQLSDWSRRFVEYPWCLTVNVSARQLAEPAFLDVVGQVVETFLLPPARLFIEVTESMFLGDFQHVCQALERLRARGIGIALDDFGSGYSSLGYLQQFRVDILKIDRMFVADIGTPRERLEILHTIADLGQNLGAKVIAEGVEREDQHQRLLELGIALAQGFWYAPPLSADRALDFALGERLP